jgi:hypothetical protein
VKGLGFRFRVQDIGFWVERAEFRAWGLMIRV